jgi:hypothetical protein
MPAALRIAGDQRHEHRREGGRSACGDPGSRLSAKEMPFNSRHDYPYTHGASKSQLHSQHPMIPLEVTASKSDKLHDYYPYHLAKYWCKIHRV